MTTAINGFANGLVAGSMENIADGVADPLRGKSDGSEAVVRISQVFAKFQGLGKDMALAVAVSVISGGLIGEGEWLMQQNIDPTITTATPKWTITGSI